jgi:erythromycin esterase
MCRAILPIAMLLIFLSALRVVGQDSLKKYVRGHTVWLATVDPDSADDSGLEAIGKAIGASRVVMLGEQDHGDAPVNLAKTRLIRYLHEKMGFNVLAFESDFFALNLGWDRLPKEEQAMIDFIRGDIFSIWTACNTCHELFNAYIPGTYKTIIPLRLAGVDNQLILRYSALHLAG